MIAAARKPVLYVGGGVIRGEATEQLRELAELTGIPVVTTLIFAARFPTATGKTSACPACTARWPPWRRCSAATC